MEPFDNQIAIIKKVIDAVCIILNVEEKKLFEKNRKRSLCEARFMCWYILRHRTKLTLEELANIFNLKDHTSCVYGLTKMRHLLQVDLSLQDQLAIIESRL